MSEFRLVSEIISRSMAQNWDEAKLEWELSEVYEADEPETCLCGHYPIIELCILVNRKHGELATVGNCCVKKFLGLPSNKIFTAIKRVRKNDSKSLNAETIVFAFEKGWITSWEYSFYLDIMRKRNLTAKQSLYKSRINVKVLNRFRTKVDR